MSNTTNGKNVNQSKLIVDGYEVENEHVVCSTYDEATLKEGTKTISLADLNKWLHENEYLKVDSEDCIGSDHMGEPEFVKVQWECTIEEILGGKSDWRETELLTEFINQ